jgi:hypothetical protein
MEELGVIITRKKLADEWLQRRYALIPFRRVVRRNRTHRCQRASVLQGTEFYRWNRLKSKAVHLPFEEAVKWVRAVGRWDTKQEWFEWLQMGEGSNAYIPSNPEVAPLFSHDLLSQTLVVVPHLSAPFRCIYHVVGRAAVD